MRQFLLAGTAAYSAALTVDAVAAGAVAFFFQKEGVPTPTDDGVEIKGKADLVLGRTTVMGGPVILPIHKHNFTFTKGVYEAPTKFTTTVVMPAPSAVGEYSLIINKNGKLFNERNKYTASVYLKEGATMSATQLATTMAKAINDNSASSGMTATSAVATVTLTAVETGPNYTIISADNLYGTAVAAGTKGSFGYGTAAYVRDLSNKAAADKGFNYTWTDDTSLLYPGFDANPLAQPNAADVGYTIFTLRFAEPRDVKTRDEVVHQIVQVAFPTGSAGIAGFETVVTELAGLT